MRHSRAILVCAAAWLLGAGCSGSIPLRNGRPEQGIAAIILGARFITPAGETQSGVFHVNLEGQDSMRSETYRVPVLPHQTMLYQVEPDVYRFNVTRNWLGWPQPRLKVRIAGRTYRMPFPREVLRKPPLDIKGKKVFSVGVFEVKLQQALPSQAPKVTVNIDDSIPTRRQLVQDVIHQMMDTSIPVEERETAIAWSRALQNALLSILSEAETERAPLFKTP
jgi:hypothetical protein